MRSIFPQYCRLLGYAILAAPILFFILFWQTGYLTDQNLLLIKAASKLIWIMGALLLFFAKRDHEEVVSKQRSRAILFGMILTIIYLFGSMIYHISIQDHTYSDSSSFLIFLILSNGSLEFYNFSKK